MMDDTTMSPGDADLELVEAGVPARRRWH